MTSSRDQERRPIAAVIPGRLAASVPGQNVQALGQQEWWKTAEQVASDWQFFSQWSEWWELATAPAFGRANELAGLIASAGEQLALGMAATVETELWRAFRDANPIDDTERGRGRGAAEEMGHRAMAELAGYYLLGTGHGLANITARALAMDPEVHPLLLDAVGTWCPPGSAERRDWLSLNRETVRDLRRVARRSGKQVLVAVAEPVTTLVMDDAWGKLGQLCGAHYHRRRPQSAGVSGVPLTSPWEASGIAAMSLNFGGREYTDGDGLAHDTSDLARRVLDGLAATMKTLLERVRDVLEDAQDRAAGSPGHECPAPGQSRAVASSGDAKQIVPGPPSVDSPRIVAEEPPQVMTPPALPTR